MAAPAPVGMIGLGLMGSALAARLVEAGMTVIGFDIDPGKCKKLGHLGGTPAISAAEVMTRCRTVIAALYDAAQIEALLRGMSRDADDAGSVLICTTTCSPGEIEAIARRSLKLGLSFVEASVSGTSAEVRQGSAMMLVAGRTETIEAARPILNILCPRQTVAGGIGNAARTKLAINLILQNNRAALAEGIAFAESMGMDARMFLATARNSAAYSAVMDSKGDKMIARDFTPQSHISQTLKDAELILEAARRQEQHLPMTLLQTALLRAAIRLAGPEADSSAIIAAIRPFPARAGASS
jgi:L-threonate 2-dehydrogenase